MDPPRSYFRALLEKCQAILSENPQDPQIQDYQAPLAKLEKDGNKASTEKNQRQWSGTIGSLEQIHDKLKKLAGGGKSTEGGDKELPPTPILKDQFRMEAQRLRCDLNDRRQSLSDEPKYEQRYKLRLDQLEKRIDKIEAEIDKVEDNLAPQQGLSKLQLAYRDHLKIQSEIEQADQDI
jgi:hypothetical protein